MLSFYKDNSGNYVIKETTYSFDNTWINWVSYTPDLKFKRINNDPWRETINADRKWFKRFYLDKFKGE